MPFLDARHARLLLLAGCTTLGVACADGPTAARQDTRANAAVAFPQDPLAVQPIYWDEWVSVSAGGDHSCGVTASGKVYCWGSNASGQLGSAGGDALRARLIDTTGLGTTRFQQVSAGDDHSCALSGSLGWGYVYCWGSNIGTQPTPLPLGLTFTSVSVGAFEGCALTPLGYAYCWPLGGTPAPVASGGTTFASISVGYDQKCGVAKFSAKAFCWGEDLYGQLGINSNRSRTSPDTVLGYTWAGVDAGKYFSCGVQNSGFLFRGGAYCWGRGDRGQVGNALTTGSYRPEAVWDAPGAALDVVSAGGRHACAIETALNGHGDAWCWGENSSGQLGAPAAGSASSVPNRVFGDRVYNQISAGRDHSCAVSRYLRAANVAGATPSTATIQCWGRNDHGQLGNTTTTNSATPVTAIHPQQRIVLLP